MGGMPDDAPNPLFVRALGHLGDRVPGEGSEELAACEAEVAAALGVCLDYTTWSWATREADLELMAGRAELPADCLRLQVVGLDRWRVLAELSEVEGEQVVRRVLVDETGTGHDAVHVGYTTSFYLDGRRLPELEPTFAEGVALMLAGMVAPRLTDNLKLAWDLKQQAYLQLKRAKLKDARMQGSNDQVPSLWEVS